MTNSTVVHDTFTLERAYPFSVERVFAFLADPLKKRRWFNASDSHSIEAFDMDFREGGAERTVYRLNEKTPRPGAAATNEARYEDIVKDVRIVMSSSMLLDGRRISTSLVTFELFEYRGSTHLILTHQGVFYEGSDGPDMRKMGWRILLDRLADAIAETAPA